MKFQNRQEQRKVTETMSGLLTSLKNYVNDETNECFEITLRILSDTGIESDTKQDT